ncbi:hypothetical protein GCM10007887_27810 [Methylobacterium haplocladii]|uniref:Uncharacterized protein n=1 Tax=Methylobacterium haplocladii TaxID=1176176 RepID=A0A512IK33_9HYPH|nr:hypothetical protein MHA02_04470 [Methylobacterium haplocladii]GLS60104.1 hypothetical protein GCM10007887_27810 [Methylobacterium haplocladii]
MITKIRAKGTSCKAISLPLEAAPAPCAKAGVISTKTPDGATTRAAACPGDGLGFSLSKSARTIATGDPKATAPIAVGSSPLQQASEAGWPTLFPHCNTFA